MYKHLAIAVAYDFFGSKVREAKPEDLWLMTAIRERIGDRMKKKEVWHAAAQIPSDAPDRDPVQLNEERCRVDATAKRQTTARHCLSRTSPFRYFLQKMLLAHAHDRI